MGDTPHDTGASAEFPRHGAPAGSAFQTHSAVVSSQPAGEGFSTSQSQSQHSQQQDHPSPRHPLPAQMGAGQQQYGPPRGGHGPFDMSGMAGALQQQQQQQQPAAASRPYNSSQGQQARYNAMAMSSPVSVSQFPGQSPVPTQQQYYMTPQPHLPPHFYGSPLAAQAQPNLPARTDLAYYPAGVVVGQQQQHHVPPYYYPQPAPFAGQPHGHPQAQQMMLGQYASPVPQPVDPRQYQHPQPGATHQAAGSSSTPDVGKDVVRGPPRKPRQSGHAIWIGNLPPQTDLMGLVHHVCKEAEGLESLFLISKSNCAFANFKDEAASVAAQRKLHDSKFLTVRLVSRLRKSTVEGPTGNTAPTGPAASAPQPDPTPESSGAREVEGADAANRGASAATSAEGKAMGSPVEGAPAQKDRFFILKSLTVEDIELSVRTNIWATQSHNEVTLNNAFHNSDNVYLVFSANKSGEYFGYARMVSPIIDDPSAAIAFAPKAQPAADVELPKAIPTEATEFAPKGRIIDDSARGTIFWEAERDDQAAAADEDGSGGGSVSGGDDGAASGEETKAWGKPFRLEWLSTARLPFYRARGLRNPWNSNREVKIARDGTELEPSVGRVLIGLFNRVSQGPGPAVGGGPVLVPGGLPYPPVARPPFQ